MAKTILLDAVAWDLVADASGNIAVAAEPYAQAQDAASAIQLFKGEAYYDTTRGVPYWDRAANAADRGVILGYAPPANFMRQKFIAAALTVPGVQAARCFLASVVGREVRGQVQITNQAGQTAATNF